MVSSMCFNVGCHTLRSRFDLDYCLLNQPDARFDEVSIRHACRMPLGLAEHHVELREAEHEVIALVDKRDLGRFSQGFRY